MSSELFMKNIKVDFSDLEKTLNEVIKKYKKCKKDGEVMKSKENEILEVIKMLHHFEKITGNLFKIIEKKIKKAKGKLSKDSKEKIKKHYLEFSKNEDELTTEEKIKILKKVMILIDKDMEKTGA